MSLSGLQAGHADLATAFGGFCDRWSWGVRSLVQDGDQFAARLGLSAGVYADTEQYLTGVAKHVTVALAGDPHLSDAQAAQASWSQDAAAVTGAPTPGGNMTWAETGSTAAQQWRPRGAPPPTGRTLNRTMARPDRDHGAAQPGGKSAFRAAAIVGWQRGRGRVSPGWDIRSDRRGTTPNRPRAPPSTAGRTWSATA